MIVGQEIRNYKRFERNLLHVLEPKHAVIYECLHQFLSWSCMVSVSQEAHVSVQIVSFPCPPTGISPLGLISHHCIIALSSLVCFFPSTLPLPTRPQAPFHLISSLNLSQFPSFLPLFPSPCLPHSFFHPTGSSCFRTPRD